MKLLIQPNDGAQPLIRAIGHAKREIQILIFRFEHREIEKALASAVTHPTRRGGGSSCAVD